MNLDSFLPAAVIFDMDGVLVDTNPFHVQKWEALLAEHGIPFDRMALPKQVLGPPNDPTLRHFFGAGITAAERRRLSEELEARFRRAFAPHAKPLLGVERLIAECQDHGILMAVASSAIRENVNFIVDALGLRAYFHVILSGDEVTQAKPHAEIFDKTVSVRGTPPWVYRTLAKDQGLEVQGLDGCTGRAYLLGVALVKDVYLIVPGDDAPEHPLLSRRYMQFLTLPLGDHPPGGVNTLKSATGANRLASRITPARPLRNAIKQTSEAKGGKRIGGQARVANQMVIGPLIGLSSRV